MYNPKPKYANLYSRSAIFLYFFIIKSKLVFLRAQADDFVTHTNGSTYYFNVVNIYD